MRFAYIDSNGNEVPIPSVDALALRIELGAITENTQLYDAQADEWGPAHTHEIFHTLSRDAKEDDGFVAPPPVAPPPVAPPAAAPPSAPEPEAEAPEAAEPVAEAAPTEAPEAEAAGDDSFGLTLAEPTPGEDEGAEEALTLADEPEEAEAGLPDLDLAPSDAFGGETAEDAPMDLAPEPADAGQDEAAVFDFGDMSGGLEVEEAFEPPQEPAMDFSPPDDGGSLDFGGGMELETAVEFDSGGFDGGDDGSLDLEAPMSDFSPADPPSWMDESESEEAVLDFTPASESAEPGEVEVPLRERRTPRNKPSPPKLKKQRNLAGPIVLIVLLLAVGVGGYAAWPLVSERLMGGGEPEVPEVFLPPISEELMPVMREASEAALAALFEQARSDWATSSTVREPPTDWLAGIYLGNAGDYPTVEGFWSGMGAFVDRVRAIGLVEFDGAVRAELQARGVTGADADAVRERADSGFVAAGPDRADIYDRFDALIDAALDLHTFLEANQDRIEYAPAAVVTTDPILEVNPATPEIGEAMGDLLDGVFDALDSLGYRDRVTSEGLRTMIRTRIQESGVR